MTRCAVATAGHIVANLALQKLSICDHHLNSRSLLRNEVGFVIEKLQREVRLRVS